MTLLEKAQSMRFALEVIGGMKVQEDTNFRDLAALLMAIARIELEKVGEIGSDFLEKESEA